ncbi:hypothetical protein WJX73_001710 [Symbiochloris irregularis]|uniref:Tryptophan-rich sensory protein n=1 Tax=Symbiochloris irregularis TaxID=706552 RepID=A0AAW1P7J8_9CHLO
MTLIEAPPRPDWSLAVSFLVVFGAQYLVPSYADSYKIWYKQIKKPSWTPPPWVFPVVWIPLKILQSVAAWLVWRRSPSVVQAAVPLGWFIAHLILGNMWNVSFFGRHQLKGSLYWMAGFWLSIAGSIALFWPVDPLSALLFAPTEVWVTIAAKLNYDIMALNCTQARKPA